MAADLGHPPSRREWDRYPDRTRSASYLSRQGRGWSEVLEAAGFGHGRGGDRSIPKREIIKAIQDVSAEFGYLPRVREWKALPDGGPIGMRTIENTFGRYSRAAAAAGFLEPQRGGNQSSFRPSGVVEEAAIVAALVGYLARERRVPTRRSWIRGGEKPSMGHIEWTFGSWGHALQAAMIDARAGSEQEIPDEDLLRILRTDEARLGRWPTALEWREAEDDRPSVNTLINRFGSFDNAKSAARLYEPGSRKWNGGNLSPSSRVTSA